MKKKFVSLLVITAMVSGGIILYEQMIFRRLSAQLQAQTETISMGYQAILTNQLLPLQDAYELTEAQNAIIERAQETDAKLKTANTMEEKLQNISRLQVSLVSFVTSVTAEQEFILDPTFVSLQQEMGERGNMREHLTAYNTTALHWNTSLQSGVGSVAARLDGTSDSILPYLRFDGEQEFVTVVEI